MSDDNKDEVENLLSDLTKKKKEEYKSCDLFDCTRDNELIGITEEMEELLPYVNIFVDNTLEEPVESPDGDH
jgi:hypothetical protein